MKITVEDGMQINKDAIAKLKKHADMIDCECPHKLIEILNVVRDFEKYTDECIEKYPEDKDTHLWLKSSALNIDQLISTTLIQLARIEGFINEKNEFIDRA